MKPKRCPRLTKMTFNVSKMSNPAKQYDLVIFGATGLVGQYAIRDLVGSIADHADKDPAYAKIRWAVAGRRRDKLQQTLLELDKELGTQLLSTVPVITADVTDLDSIEALAACTTVLLNAVGPYDTLAPPVIEACLRHRTAHLDLSAELNYIEGAVLKYSKTALESGTLIISAAGFCSTVPEMAIALLRRHFPGTLHSVETFIDANYDRKRGYKINFGSFHSVLYYFVHIRQMLPIRRQMQKLYHSVRLPTSRITASHQHWLAIPGLIGDSAQSGLSAVLPIPDRAVVKRTNHLLYEAYGDRPVVYATYVRARYFPAMLSACLWLPMTVCCGGCGRSVLKRNIECLTLGGFSHAGPSRQQVEGARFELRAVGKGWKEVVGSAREEPVGKRNQKMTITLRGPDPAYVITAASLVQLGLTILLDRHLMPRGGVLTVGAAFRNTRLWERMAERGIKVELGPVETM